MTPEYLYELANIADPSELWRRLSAVQQMQLGLTERRQLDTGIALRRYASYIDRLDRAIELKQSYLVTPGPNHGVTQTKFVPIPKKHKVLLKDYD